MIQFHSKNLWKRIGQLSKKAKAKRAAIAYVTKDLPLALKSNDVLVTDGSDAAIGSGQTSAKVLGQLHRRGVRLYSYGPLHSKVVVLDGSVFASSANLSDSSQRTLLEAGIETDNPTVVSQAIAFIESLAEQSDPIDDKFIARIGKIPVKSNWHPRTKGKSPKTLTIPDDPKTWLIDLYSAPESEDPTELARVEEGKKAAEEFRSNAKSETWWADMPRNLRISKYAKRGDSLVVMWSRANKGSPKAVYHHCPVLVNQPEPNCHRIYYEQLPNSEKKALRWQEFKKLAKKVGLRISKHTNQVLTPEQSSALHELWEEARKKSN